MKTIRVYLSGSVQGVFFRKYLEEKANEFGIRGFVRNLDDGRVEVLIEGRDENVNTMLEICKKGNQHTKVTDIQIQELKNQGFEGFKVLRM
jgi:acylphosphatase